MGKIKRSLPENSLIHHPCNSIFICFMHRLEERIDHFNLRWLGTDRSSIARNLWPVSGTNNLIKFQNVKSMFQMNYYLGLFFKWKHGTVFSQHRLVNFFLNLERISFNKNQDIQCFRSKKNHLLQQQMAYRTGQENHVTHPFPGLGWEFQKSKVRN